MEVSALAGPNNDGSCLVAIEIARQHAMLLLESASDFVQGHGLGSDLLDVTATASRIAEDDFDLVWDSSFGALHVALAARDPDAIASAIVQIALRCGTMGHMLEIDRNVVTLPNLRFQCWSLANVNGVCIDPHREQFRFHTDVGSVMIGRSEGGDLRSSQELRRNPMARVLGRDIVCLFRDNLLCPGGADISEKVADDEIEALPKRLEVSLSLLSVQSSRYCGWVTALLRAVAPWSNPLNSLPGGSGSSNLLPGTVAISASPEGEPMIDSLIHEICHHYFYLALRLGKVARDSGRLFYNPILRCDRPIEMILLAFHAFANVYRYCTEAMDRGVGDRDYLAYRMAVLSEQLPILDAHLASCGTLTELGESLWWPLHHELAPMLENRATLGAGS